MKYQVTLLAIASYSLWGSVISAPASLAQGRQAVEEQNFARWCQAHPEWVNTHAEMVADFNNHPDKAQAFLHTWALQHRGEPAGGGVTVTGGPSFNVWAQSNPAWVQANPARAQYFYSHPGEAEHFRNEWYGSSSSSWSRSGESFHHGEHEGEHYGEHHEGEHHGEHHEGEHHGEHHEGEHHGEHHEGEHHGEHHEGEHHGEHHGGEHHGGGGHHGGGHHGRK